VGWVVGCRGLIALILFLLFFCSSGSRMALSVHMMTCVHAQDLAPFILPGCFFSPLTFLGIVCDTPDILPASYYFVSVDRYAVTAWFPAREKWSFYVLSFPSPFQSTDSILLSILPPFLSAIFNRCKSHKIRTTLTPPFATPFFVMTRLVSSFAPSFLGHPISNTH